FEMSPPRSRQSTAVFTLGTFQFILLRSTFHRVIAGHFHCFRLKFSFGGRSSLLRNNLHRIHVFRRSAYIPHRPSSFIHFYIPGRILRKY
ncbi:hypothetical protein PMAYCL1PPCAC_08315, partial [Pristionchus mayeri]